MAIDQRPCGQRKHLRRKCQLDAQYRNGAAKVQGIDQQLCIQHRLHIAKNRRRRTRRDRHPHPGVSFAAIHWRASVFKVVHAASISRAPVADDHDGGLNKALIWP